MNYIVSIVIPLYNVREYVESALNSALNQTFKSIEYILVDDCSTDGTMDIVESVLQNHYRKSDVYILHHKVNKGLSAARNTGLENSSGEYVFFMDSDDEITVDCIEHHYNAIKSNSVDFTIANIKLVGAKSIHVRGIDESAIKISPIESYFRQMWNVSAWNKLYRMQFLKKHNLRFRDGLIHEDILWSYHLSLYSSSIAIVEYSTYLYKIRRNSITTNLPNIKKIDSLIYILEEIKKYDDKSHIRLRDRFVSFWAFNTALVLLNVDSNIDSKKMYYNNIRNLVGKNISNLYSLILHLPYRVFSFLITPIYTIYRKSR